jgi:hypothetical protein
MRELRKGFRGLGMRETWTVFPRGVGMRELRKGFRGLGMRELRKGFRGLGVRELRRGFKGMKVEGRLSIRGVAVLNYDSLGVAGRQVLVQPNERFRV